MVGRFSNRTGTSDGEWMARGIVWILLQFDITLVFALRALSSSNVPIVLLNQPGITIGQSFSHLPLRATFFFLYLKPPSLCQCSIWWWYKGTLPLSVLTTWQFLRGTLSLSVHCFRANATPVWENFKLYPSWIKLIRLLFLSSYGV